MTDMAKSKSAGKVGNLRKAKNARASTAAVAQVAREAVVILPMHRSGSSALSRVLNLLGCDLPKTLMLGNETNPTGHWESVEIRALNDDILTSGGSQWQDWQAFNPNWYRTSKPHEFRDRALKVLEKEVGSSSLFVLKDPRVCRIFPFWRDTFAAAGIEPKIIMTVRHPQEVAASLERRKENGIPVLVGLLLWLRYMLEAEADTRGMTRATVSYDRLLQDPIGLAESLQDQLGLFWPSLSELQADVISSYMDPSLRHHNVAADRGLARATEFREWLEQVYEIFLRWSREGENGDDYSALDAVRAELNGLAGSLHQVIGTVTSQASELSRQAAEIDSLSETNRATAEKLAARDGAVDDLQGKLQTLSSALEQRSHEAEETAAALTAAQEQIREQEQAAKALQGALADARATGKADATRSIALQAELRTAHQTLKDRDGLVTQLREKTDRLDAEAATQADDMAQMARMILEKEEALKRRNVEAHKVAAEVTTLQQDLERLGQELAARSEALAAAEGEREALLHSTSWKLTAPLRRLSMMLKR
jgi:hypothetical protein